VSTTTSSHADLQTEVGQLIERRANLATEIANIDESIDAIHQIVTGTRTSVPQRAATGKPVGRIGAPVKPKSESSGRDGRDLAHTDAALIFVEKNGSVTLKEVNEFLHGRGDRSPHSTIRRLIDKGELRKYIDEYGIKHVDLV